MNGEVAAAKELASRIRAFLINVRKIGYRGEPEPLLQEAADALELQAERVSDLCIHTSAASTIYQLTQLRLENEQLKAAK